jgi:uncharacterized protein YeaO (DUF488 family)
VVVIVFHVKQNYSQKEKYVQISVFTVSGKDKDMIIIGNMKYLNRQYDELWFVMRSMDWFIYEKTKSLRFAKYDKTKLIKKNYELLMQPNVKIISELSPSEGLFRYYLSCKEHKTWDEKRFKNKYVPWFLDSINNEDGRDRLNELWRLDKASKTVLLICTCQEENMCHRSILAGILASVGCNVQVQGNLNDYLVYGEMFKELPVPKEE